MQLTNWFNFYCLVRTFSSSLEAVLTIVAVYHWLATCDFLEASRKKDKDRAQRARLPSRSA